MILSYTLSCSVEREVEFTTQFKPILEITLNVLTPSTLYVCSVYASSSGGDGPPTDEIPVSTESKVILNMHHFRNSLPLQ